MLYKYLLGLTAMLISLQLSAQSISGRIIDSPDRQAIGQAHISLVNTLKGSVTDAAGYFELTDLQAGTYYLHISRMGYETREMKVVLEENTRLVLEDIILQPGVHQLNKEVIISAQRMPQMQFSSPQAVNVLNQSQLVQSAPRSAAEALFGLPGLWVQKTNHGGGSPFIRGMTGNQALQMIDGIRLNNAISRYGPNQYFNTIDPNSIQQVEVIRGAGSVQYGSDAMGGVVQVFTKSPDFSKDGWQWDGQLFGKLMSGGMEQSGRAELQFSGEKAAFYGGFSTRNFGDLIAGADVGKLVPSGYREMSADLKAKFRIADQQLLTIAYQFLDQDDVHRWDQVAQRGYQLWKFDPQNRRLGYVRWEKYSNNRWLSQVRTTLSFNRSVEGRVSQRQDSNLRRREDDAINTYGAMAEIISRPADFYTISSGLEYYHDRISSSASDTDLESGISIAGRGAYPASARASSLALFSLHTLAFDRLTLTYGGRLNHFSVSTEDDAFGNINNAPTALVGNLAASYALWPQHRIVASVNSGFRAPNIDDLTKFGSFDSGFEVPISALDPEKSLTMELGFKSRTDNFSSAFFLYRTNLFDLIDRVPSTFNGSENYQGDPVFRKENVNRAYIQGAEAELEVKLGQSLTAFGSLIYAYGQNSSADEPMRRIPPLNGRLGLQYQHQTGFYLRGEYLYATTQDRLSGGDISDHRIPEGGTPGWEVLNLYAGYHWRWLRVNAGAQNLLDETYKTHGSGVYGYGRSAWLALNFSIL
jgi:outer membrane receptor protein involved in Fe transport